jgi:hypothetical protein
MASAAPLSTIIALARAGALEHAWSQFQAGGHDARGGDPAALTVKGRLLKDRALRARGEERRQLFVQSAEAYRMSAALRPGTYPLINAATLSLLSGDRAAAAELARDVLERIEREPEEPETPYWRAATVAEAQLLLARRGEAKAALSAAVAAAPRAWEDHASTLRQFLLIEGELGGDSAWLDMLRPPRSAFWAPAPAPAPLEEAGLRRHVAEAVARERIGFVFATLNGPAQIAAAEAALEAGAELHLVVPGGNEAFAAAFVDAEGAGWRARYDALAGAAETLHMVRPIGPAPSPAMLGLAGTVAAGAARLNAERLMSDALALRPASGEAEAGAPSDVPADAQRPIALVSVNVGDSGDAAFDSRLARVREALGGMSAAAVPPHLAGDKAVVGFGSVEEAARLARRLLSLLRGRVPVRIAAHFGFVPLIVDPFLSDARPSESGARIIEAVGQAAPPDTACVTLDFAAALAAGSAEPSCAHWIGELHAFDGGTPIPLYALRPLDLDD